MFFIRPDTLLQLQPTLGRFRNYAEKLQQAAAMSPTIGGQKSFISGTPFIQQNSPLMNNSPNMRSHSQQIGINNLNASKTQQLSRPPLQQQQLIQQNQQLHLQLTQIQTSLLQLQQMARGNFNPENSINIQQRQQQLLGQQQQIQQFIIQNQQRLATINARAEFRGSGTPVPSTGTPPAAIISSAVANTSETNNINPSQLREQQQMLQEQTSPLQSHLPNTSIEPQKNKSDEKEEEKEKIISWDHGSKPKLDEPEEGSTICI